MSQAILDLGPEATSASTVLGALTPSLAQLLLAAADWREAVKTISGDEVALAEARRAEPVVRRLGGPMGKDAVYVALQPLIILYGAPDFGDSSAGDGLLSSWISIYTKALEKLPREALDYAVDTYIATSTKPFFPKPGELNALALPRAEDPRKIAWRLRKIVDAQPAAARESEEDRERGRQMVAETLAAIRGGAGLRSALRPAQSPHEAAERLRQSAQA